MFLDFFFRLRSKKIPVSTSEYLDLLQVLNGRLNNISNFDSKTFYLLARSCLVKDIKHYDSYDLIFSETFSNLINDESSFKNQLKEWLENALQQELNEERKNKALRLPPEDLIKELEQRLKEQKEKHDGGNKWIGTGGTSPFGHSGFNPQGIRIGGMSRNKSALAVAGERKFKDYRSDETLNIRQMKLALKNLRELKEEGKPRLSISQTIYKTCQNAGEIDLVFKRSRKNNLKLVLLMDVGGSMTPYAKQVEKLFSAAHQIEHFKEFKFYYFHNIFYQRLYKNANMEAEESVEFEQLYRRFSSGNTKIIIVGDAAMAPYELFYMTQQMRDYYTYSRSIQKNSHYFKNDLTGIQRVQELTNFYPSTIWLNPEPFQLWNTPTISAIKEIIPMYFLSLDGLKKGVQQLKTTLRRIE